MTDDVNPFAQFAPAVMPPQAAALNANPFAQFLPPAAPLNKYDQAAADKMAKLKEAGIDPAYGVAQSGLNGAMFGGLPTVAAGVMTPFSMLEHGTWDPSEGYNYAKATQNAELAAGQKAHPVANTVANLAGGVLTGAGAAASGITFVPKAAGLAKTALGMAGDGAAYGALTGALSGEGSDRITDALKGAAAGGALGGVLPVAGSMLARNPAVSNISAWLNPEGFASAQLARAIRESGNSPERLQAALDNATAAGQPNYALADALGNAGQRMLTTVTKSPGEGRTAAAEFLENRQAGQAGDVSSQLAEALGAPRTATQTTADMTAQRTAAADTNYGAARNSPGAVDVSPAIALADQTLQPGVTALMRPQTDIDPNSISQAVAKAKGLLTDGQSQLSDFNQVFQAKEEIDSIISRATSQQQRVLIPIKNALDDALAKASPSYTAARDTFAQQSRAIKAVGEGGDAARTGRSADTIQAFNGMAPDAQQGFRVGYGDKLIERAERTPHGANAARPLLNDAQKANLEAMSLHQGPTRPGSPDEIATRLGRSNTMFQTRAKALGGSATVENANDQAASGIDPLALYESARGGVMGMVKLGANVAGNFLGGSTEAVRSALGKALMMHGAGSDVVGALGPAVMAQIKRAALARAIAGSMFGGAAGIIGGEGSKPR